MDPIPRIHIQNLKFTFQLLGSNETGGSLLPQHSLVEADAGPLTLSEPVSLAVVDAGRLSSN